HGIAFADAMLTTDPSTIQSRLEEILAEELGPMTADDIVTALIELDGGEALKLHTKILADAARNVYRFASILSRDQHSGHYTVALPAGTSAEVRMFFERAFTRPPAFQSSFDQDIEIWWTALDLTSEDSMLHQRGMELAQQIDRDTRDLLWSFPR